MNLLVIYNPNAGGGKAAKLLPKIKDYLARKKVNSNFLLTEYKGHAIKLVQNTDLSAYDGIIASGGDGTLFEVVNGYYKNPLKEKPPIGIIPNGTGNAFVKELELDAANWQAAVDIILCQHLRRIDVARFRQQNTQNYFINIIGTGFVADVAKAAVWWKFLGKAAYNIAVFQQILSLKSRPMRITLDGETIQRDCTLIEVSNSRYTGTTFLMAPYARLDDGMLDITILNRLSRIRLIQIFKTIFTGKHIHEAEVETFLARKVTIHCEQTLELVPDGEILGKTPVEIECLQQDLALFWPSAVD